MRPELQKQSCLSRTSKCMSPLSSRLNSKSDIEQCTRPSTLLLHQKGRICHNPLLSVRRPLLPFHLEHETGLRLCICLVAKFYIGRGWQGRAGQRGSDLGFYHHESLRGPLAEHWACGHEEASEELQRKDN